MPQLMIYRNATLSAQGFAGSTVVYAVTSHKSHAIVKTLAFDAFASPWWPFCHSHKEAAPSVPQEQGDEASLTPALDEPEEG